ncbi:MAG TPA: aldehyde dehydrogenase family protein [Flexivirga sp.]|uniref:aldehyde dehydrogenase family protein n=1 Tax=Flexivirga sp. TaxID=1962927 RepID=UPI002B84F7F7|nr:aldehyde dehydrogenase family protein [Flexivirga sp.]HWC21390.1 aldehyde dehydrogenase family protein [Flexivirga sp.]
MTVVGEQTPAMHTAPLGGALIAGVWRSAPLDLPVHDPQDGRMVGRVARCSAQDVDAAVRAAAESMCHDWPLHARTATLARAADAVLERSEFFAAIIGAEGVKTLAEARAEVARCVETLRTAAASGDVLTGEVLQLDASARGAGRTGWFTREPLGVVGAISSFNDPLNLVAHKLAPVVLAGAAVVLKPSDQTPLTALHLAEVLLEAGMPPARLSVVCGGPEVGEALVAHPDVAVVSFTGGTRTGEAITRSAGVKKLLMELGGNNATIVCADADLDLAVKRIVSGAFGVAGQNCLSVQRVLVEQPAFEQVLRGVVSGARSLRVGSKLDATTDVGPLVSAQATRRVAGLVDDAVEHGARLLTGGHADGNFYRPTVLTGVAPDAPILREEVFGPVVIVEPVASAAEAVRRANDSQFALQAGVFTKSLENATRISAGIIAGAVLVNDTSDFRLDSMPFGGFGHSGIGREGIRSATLELTAPKCVLLSTAD